MISKHIGSESCDESLSARLKVVHESGEPANPPRLLLQQMRYNAIVFASIMSHLSPGKYGGIHSQNRGPLALRLRGTLTESWESMLFSSTYEKIRRVGATSCARRTPQLYGGMWTLERIFIRSDVGSEVFLPIDEAPGGAEQRLWPLGREAEQRAQPKRRVCGHFRRGRRVELFMSIRTGSRSFS